MLFNVIHDAITQLQQVKAALQQRIHKRISGRETKQNQPWETIIWTIKLIPLMANILTKNKSKNRSKKTEATAKNENWKTIKRYYKLDEQC